MRPGEAERLLRWYPRGWRQRYGDELVAMIEDTLGDQLPGRRMRWSLTVAGVRERIRRSWVVGPGADPAQRIRGGATLVFWGWALLVPAGISFAKFMEHWQVAIPASQRALPSLAVTSAQALAVVGAAAVLAVVVMAGPALLRRLRHGAWPQLRSSAVVAGGLAAAWLGLMVGVVLWAHRLSPAQRNGGSHAYGAVAYGWAGLTILTVAAWTVLGIKAERQLASDSLLIKVEAAAAVVTTASIAVVTAAMLTWWASMASAAPWFLQGFILPPGQAPAGLAASPSSWNWRLLLTALAMVTATLLAVAGTTRIVRSRYRPVW